MNIISEIIITLTLIIVITQFIYSFFYNKIECPEFPEIKNNEEIPNNEHTTKYIYKNLINAIDDDIDSLEFIKNNVIFANNYNVNYQMDAESIMSRIKYDIRNKNIFNQDNIKYIQSNDENKVNEFKNLYNLNYYPSPLIYYQGSNLLFAYIKEKLSWKILLDVAKI